MLTAEQIIYNALVYAAKAGKRCPTNRELASMIDATSTGTAVRYLQLLDEQGAIKLHSGNNRRVVVIPALGLRTYGPKPQTHWRERLGESLHVPRKRKFRLYAETDRKPVPDTKVDSRTCTRCGARKGCCEHAERWLA